MRTIVISMLVLAKIKRWWT